MGPTPRLWLFMAALAAVPASAQIPDDPGNRGLVVRDGTLGSGPAGVVPPGFDDLGQHADYLIRADLGKQSGGNLFHSFDRFSIGSGEWATFTGQGARDPGAIDNVISRVTGGDPSQIDGRLRSTISGADVWLLNPSGVVFGEGARLDVPGSFHASTGDYVGFEGSLERFYADGRESSVLSTARPEAFGFLGESPAEPITVTGATLATIRTGDGLELVGGDVTLTRATLSAAGGEISIRGGRIVVEQGSQVLAENVGGIRAGTIRVDASESLDVDASLLSVATWGAGDAGTIEMTGGDVRFRNGHGTNSFPTLVGARADTFGSGDAGTIEIDTHSLEVTTGAGLTAETFGPFGGTGAGGSIAVRVPSGSVQIASGGSLRVNSVVSPGNAGDIEISADSLTLDALDPRTGRPVQTLITAWPFGGFGFPEPQTPASGGTIHITARSIELVNGTVPFLDALIGTQCLRCAGRAGDITIHATEQMRVDGHIFAATFFGASGDGGDITIDAGSLVIPPGGNIYAGIGSGSESSGLGGNVTIDAGSLLIAPGGFVGAGTEIGSTGDAGNVSITAGSVHVGMHADFPTAARQIPLGVVSASSLGSGAAGNIEIDAGSLVIAPAGFVGAQADRGSSGTAGGIRVHADTVHIGPHPDVPTPLGRMPLSMISTTTFSGAGNAGSIDVQATQSIFLTYEGGRRFDLAEFLRQPPGTPSFNSGVFSSTVGGGGGGSVTLRAPDVTITHGAGVSTSTVGGGQAGFVSVNGSRILVTEGGDVNSVSLVDPVAGTPGGDAGSVTLEATESIAVVGRNPEFGASRVSSNSLGSGAAGSVTLTAPRILIDGGVVATAALPFEEQEGERGGEIALNTGELLVREGGRVDASSFIAGPAGSIDARASESIVVDGQGSGIASRTGGSGTGGDVRLEASRIELTGGGEASARSEAGLGDLAEIFPLVGDVPEVATGDAGTVTLVADEVLLDGGTIATNAEAADGGDITIQATELVHLDAGVITASVTGGTGGNVTIDPEVVILENGSRIVAQAGEGTGGRIQITADNYFAFPGTVVDASSDLGIDGVVEIHTPDVDLAGKIATLPSTPLDAASLIRESCAARRSGDRAGSFAVRGNGGIPAEPDGWLPASVAFEGIPHLATEEPQAGASPLRSSSPVPRLLASAGCR